MAVPFRKMRPELREVLAGAKAEIAALRRVIEQRPDQSLDARRSLLKLAQVLADHGGVTHWAISMRLFGKGDFFARLEKGTHPRTNTYERALRQFSAIWPEDLAWPISTPRPNPQTNKEAP